MTVGTNEGCSRIPPRGLTDAQRRLVERHRSGLVRLALNLATRGNMDPTDVLLLVADSSGRIGRALARALPDPTIGPVVLPGKACELEAWVTSLAIHGPVWDVRNAHGRIEVIVIDARDCMAVTRV